MLKLKKKLLNHEVVVSLCFSIYGVFYILTLSLLMRVK
ncbi:hypothetical protein PAUR_a3328 [Pseudoalteromonas aurantia 208]|uniref:Uncharacterized protein n=1 Tax=Pseudoalteromonas aurantia 208 TaxID=1314867 RepID=A0ABR9E5U4_9GAMM|nr:hypothetical protein [Pseudoalteromonas aurantia 208]